MCQHIIHVLHGSGFDIVGLNSGIVQSNRSELHPVDEDLDDVDTAADAEDNLDVM